MNRFIRYSCLLGCLAALAPAPAAEAPLARFQYTQLLMGVAVRLVVYAPDEAAAERPCAAAFRRIADLEGIMSDYRPRSELMRLCAQAGGDPVPVSADLFLVLQRALALSRRTGGAFDVTVGPLVALWRQARKSGQLPAAEDLERARALVGWEKLILDPEARAARLLVPGMRLDLGGIAKGYAGDCALAVLKAHGITRAMVEAGGEIVASGPPPGREGWNVDLTGFGSAGAPRVLSLRDAALSTSGDTEQFVEIGGRRYSHVVDPRTGVGLTTRIAVTVVAPDGITADSLSTAASVLGPEAGRALIEAHPGCRAYIRTAE